VAPSGRSAFLPNPSRVQRPCLGPGGGGGSHTGTAPGAGRAPGARWGGDDGGRGCVGAEALAAWPPVCGCSCGRVGGDVICCGLAVGDGPCFCCVDDCGAWFWGVCCASCCFCCVDDCGAWFCGVCCAGCCFWWVGGVLGELPGRAPEMVCGRAADPGDCGEVVPAAAPARAAAAPAGAFLNCSSRSSLLWPFDLSWP
jgi:hypothetical protein